MTKVWVFRSAYGYDVDKVSDESAVDCSEAVQPSKTQQQFAKDADINEIVRRFGLTGEMPDNPRLPSYGDFTNVVDFQSAMNAVRAAQEGFMELPAELRARFANDPQRLLEFLEDGRNRDEAVRLGLVSKPLEVDAAGVEAVAAVKQ